VCPAARLRSRRFERAKVRLPAHQEALEAVQVEASAKLPELPSFDRLHLDLRAAAEGIRNDARKKTPASVLSLVKTRAAVANAERLAAYVGAGWAASSSTRRCDSSRHMGPEP
jgi:hypothetical protein